MKIIVEQPGPSGACPSGLALGYPSKGPALSLVAAIDRVLMG
jgi:hypothetical protein